VKPSDPLLHRDTSAYDHQIASANGTDPDIFSSCVGKVTLLFNVAAGCGNYPQMSALNALDKHYADEDDFQIKAIVVDDFTCHGFGEFNGGLEEYAQKSHVDESFQKLNAGQIAEKYAREQYEVEFTFSECINGRFDKHQYDPEWRPGAQYEQEMHPFWQHMLHVDLLPRDENNLPYHFETSPWAAEKQTVDENQQGFYGLQGNFEKFLVSRDGKSFKRYANGFLLGERDADGEGFSWWDEPEITDSSSNAMKSKWRSYPNPLHKRGIKESLAHICADIDALLASEAPPTEQTPGSLEISGASYAPPTESARAALKLYGAEFTKGLGVQETI
jgi:glutathione peroxidase-family protein